MTVKNIFMLLGLFFCLSFVLLPTVCSAQTHPITDEELNRLDSIFVTLEQNNQMLEQKLQKASELLEKSDKQIQQSNQQINQLEMRLTQADKSVTQAQDYSKKVETSFNEYVKETDKEVKKLKTERTLLIIGIIAMGFKH